MTPIPKAVSDFALDIMIRSADENSDRQRLMMELECYRKYCGHDSQEWREGAIRYQKIGYASIISVERNGKWIDVIKDSAVNPSHIVEAAGINHCIQQQLETKDA